MTLVRRVDRVQFYMLTSKTFLSAPKKRPPKELSSIECQCKYLRSVLGLFQMMFQYRPKYDAFKTTVTTDVSYLIVSYWLPIWICACLWRQEQQLTDMQLIHSSAPLPLPETIYNLSFVTWTLGIIYVAIKSIGSDVCHRWSSVSTHEKIRLQQGVMFQNLQKNEHPFVRIRVALQRFGNVRIQLLAYKNVLQTEVNQVFFLSLRWFAFLMLVYLVYLLLS